MTIEDQLSEALAKLQASEQTIIDITTKLVESTKAIDVLNQTVAAKDTEIAATSAKVIDLEKANAELQAKVTSAESKAAEIVAKLGIPEASAPVVHEQVVDTPETIRAKFAAMQPGPERTAFYQANRTILKQ